MTICDFLFSADLCVGKVEPAADELVNRLGLPRPGPKAYVRYPEEGWDVVFALVNKAFAAAPTRLELIAPLEGNGPGPRVYQRQAPRPIRTHATVVATPVLDEVVERVRRAGVAHWLQPATDHVPFDRLWLGSPPGDLGKYDRAADGGFVFEFIPSNSSAFAPGLFAAPQDEPKLGQAGYRRIVHRSFVVADLDAKLRLLADVLGWLPAHEVRDEPSRGYRFVTMTANHAHGAALRIVQPTSADSTAGRTLASQGEGPWAITLSAYDLSVTVADLRARGVHVDEFPAGQFEPEALVPHLSSEIDAPFVIVPDC